MEAATKSADQLQGKLVLTGSSTVAPLAAEIAKRYETEHSGVRIDVQSGGSSRGIADARQGVANVGMVSWSLEDNEKDLQTFTIAKDGISIIVNNANPVKSLTNKQIVDIYTDKINNWKQVGGSDAPITVVNKAEGRSTLELFAEHFKIDIKNIKADVVIGDNEQGIKTVGGNPNAVGYVSIGSGEYAATHQTPIKLLPIEGIAASITNVTNGTFPISHPLNALDPLSSEVVEDLIAKLRLKYTVVVVTHNLAQAKRIADHVAVFWFQDGAGQLIEFGSVTQIFESPQHTLTGAYVTGRTG